MPGRRREPHPEADYDTPSPPGAAADPLVLNHRAAVAAAEQPLPASDPDSPAAAADDEPVETPAPATLHLISDTLVNYVVETRCGLTVDRAKATYSAEDVSCGNCQRAAG